MTFEVTHLQPGTPPCDPPPTNGTSGRDGGHILLIDPEPASRTLVLGALEEADRARAVTSVGSVASVPAEELGVPLTLVVSSAVDERELAHLGPLLTRADTHVVLIVRGEPSERYGQLCGFPVDAVVRTEDVRGPAMLEALTPRGADMVTVSRRVLRQLLLSAAAPQTGPSRPPSLTARETETLNGMAAGLSNRQIAHLMGITEHGVKRHVAHILAKLNCQNRTTAVAVAFRTGLVSEQPFTV